MIRVHQDFRKQHALAEPYKACPIHVLGRRRMFSPRAVQVPTPLSSFRKKKAIPHHRRFPHINSSFPEIGLFCLYPTHIEEFI